MAPLGNIDNFNAILTNILQTIKVNYSKSADVQICGNVNIYLPTLIINTDW